MNSQEETMISTMPKTETTRRQFALSQSQLEEFHRDGVLGPFKLFEPEEMEDHWRRLRLDLFDRTNVVYPDAQPGSGVYDYDRHLDNSFLAEVVGKPQIVQRMASILGPNVLCWRSEFFPKYPGDEGTDWHQADTFGGGDGVPHVVWPNGSDFGGALTAWIAFTNADMDTGCMQFIPGTQRTMYYDESKGMHYDPSRVNKKEVNGVMRGFFGYDWREIQVDPDWEPDESRATTIPCKAGEFLIFWSTLMHASVPHRGLTKRMRLAFASRYVPTSVTIYDAMRESNVVRELGGTFSLENYGAVLVAGCDAFRHNRIRTQTTRGRPFVPLE